MKLPTGWKISEEAESYRIKSFLEGFLYGVAAGSLLVLMVLKAWAVL